MVAEFPGPDLETVFKQLPPLAGLRPGDFEIKPLSGYTNFNYHLKNDKHDWVLRIPKQETNPYINRSQETHNADCAYALGIAPECVWRDESGFSLTETVLNSRPLNALDLKNESVIKALMKTFSRLHKSEKMFRGRIDLAASITRYFRLAPEHRRKQIEPGYKIALGKIKALSSQNVPLVPSHNDPVLENILIDPAEQIWIIDWEYASMASPYWDLAILCNAADFDRPQSAHLLDEYQKTGVSLKLTMLDEYRFVLRVLSISWMAAFTLIDIGDELGKLKNAVTNLGS